RRRQEELAHVRENELAHAGRLSAMGELASGLAHELNQPLAAIANFSRGAVRRMDAPVGLSQAQVRQTLTKVADQAERAGEIIRRIRRFVVSREPQHGEFSLTESAQGVLEMIGYELRARSIDAVVTADPQTPAVFGDAVQIEQVILNLLTNAMDAVVDRPGAGRIDLRVGPAEGPSRARGARVEVVDDGAGIPDDVRDHVFEPFFTTKPNGVGVGLVISQSIVIAHRGRLDTAPNPPHGTRVGVWLPCRAV
ncbi:MAG: ATP-binding protein, partial [Planctomycetota bacterium]